MTTKNPCCEQICYPLAEAAALVGYSVESIKEFHEKGELPFRYANTKPVVLRKDLVAWAEALPTVRPKRGRNPS